MFHRQNKTDIDCVSSRTRAKKKNLDTPKSTSLPEHSPIPSSVASSSRLG